MVRFLVLALVGGCVSAARPPRVPSQIDAMQWTVHEIDDHGSTIARRGFSLEETRLRVAVTSTAEGCPSLGGWIRADVSPAEAEEAVRLARRILAATPDRAPAGSRPGLHRILRVRGGFDQRIVEITAPTATVQELDDLFSRWAESAAPEGLVKLGALREGDEVIATFELVGTQGWSVHLPVEAKDVFGDGVVYVTGGGTDRSLMPGEPVTVRLRAPDQTLVYRTEERGGQPPIRLCAPISR
jgi:hypothetical protein